MKSITIASLFILVISCNTPSTTTLNGNPNVQNSVKLMMDSIAKNVTAKGPTAWLPYFANTPEFFMVSDGALVFPNYDSAFSFTKNTLPTIIAKIQLQWGDIRIVPFSDAYASVGAFFHEDLTYTSGKESSENGYFTAVASKTGSGWQLLNAHWSTNESQP